MVEAKTSPRAHVCACAGVNVGRVGARMGVIRARVVAIANDIKHMRVRDIHACGHWQLGENGINSLVINGLQD